MAARAIATPPDWRAEQREIARAMQRLAAEDPKDLDYTELRALESHHDVVVAARAADEIARRAVSPSPDAKKRPTPE